MAHRMQEDDEPKLQRRWRLRLGRDTITYAIGIGGILHEMLISDNERIGLLVLFAGMIGLPGIFRFEEWRKDK